MPANSSRRRPMRKMLFNLTGAIFCATAIFAIVAPSVVGQRRPVLPQIDLPHPYYFREMYLPQLTSGPSSVAWSPDSQSVVYSMGGSLWRQKISETRAVQLTDGAGYDYQPDWSPDGKSIVYCTYANDALELWVLDVGSGANRQLTHGGAVNVEPRWSPDGKKLVFVSTAYNKRFHIFVGDFRDGKLENVMRLTGETKSPLPRYYYSAYDMEISPVWSRDGQEILFVSNRGHMYGTGGFWRMKAEPGAEAREIHYEETNWKARPDFSPDGSRMVYSSYLGRNWHQLWLLPANGGDAFPISYGDWDDTNARWSPDGKTIAFICNRTGATTLWLYSASGGEERRLDTNSTNQYLRPRASISIILRKESQPARISVTDEAGKFYAADGEWIHADDGYDRRERAFEAHYFYPTVSGGTSVFVPKGIITVEVMHGFEKRPERRIIDTRNVVDAEAAVFELATLGFGSDSAEHWVSGDLHVHMNYGGTYRNDLEHLEQQGRAEGLALINELIVNKEQRFPDMAYAEKPFDQHDENGYAWSFGPELIVPGQEFHTSYWGHRGLLNLENHLLIPGYAGYPYTAAASLYPMNADVYDMAHKQGALIGAVHPFDEIPDPFAKPAQRITDELPVDVALGKLDYMEIVGFSDHRSTAAVWYRLLNLGFRIPAGAGTDAMADFASLRGPVGMSRVFARVPKGPPETGTFLEALKKGRTFATNGPLLEFSLGGAEIGEELNFDDGQQSVPFTAKLRSIVPVDHLEVVCNGKVAQTLRLDAARTASDVAGTVALPTSGWCVLRTSSEQAEYPVLDNYVYATTSPIYVNIGGKRARSPGDAKYFAAWIDRVTETTAGYPDWNSAEEKKYVLGRLAEAKKIYDGLAQ